MNLTFFLNKNFVYRVDSGRGKQQAPVIIESKKSNHGDNDDDEDDTFIVEEDPALSDILEMVRNHI